MGYISQLSAAPPRPLPPPQTWLGGAAIFQMAQTLAGPATPLAGPLIGWLGITCGELAAFLLFYALQAVVLARGMVGIRVLERYSAPLLSALTAALLAWAINAAGGVGPMLSTPSQFGPGMPREGQFWAVFIPALSANIGYWATLALNIADFTRCVLFWGWGGGRRAASGSAQEVGADRTEGARTPVLAGMPRASARSWWGRRSACPSSCRCSLRWGSQSRPHPWWGGSGGARRHARRLTLHAPPPRARPRPCCCSDPIVLLGKLEGVVPITLALIGLVLATLTTNIAANTVAPANALLALAPRRFTFNSAALLTSVVGLLVQPWRLVQSADSFYTRWLIGYAVLLGPTAGIVTADYWLVRGQQLNVDALYSQSPRARYWYRGGWNPAALAALLVGAAPTLPGFLHSVAGVPVPHPVFLQLYSNSWVVSYLLSLFLYSFLMKRWYASGAAPAPILA